MDQSQIDKFKAILNEQLERLMNQAADSRTELSSGDFQEIEYLDRANRHSNQAMQLRIRTRESRLIKKVMMALERIENGTYGTCEACGEPITIKRLEARPVTTKCIECKEREELMEALSN